MESKKTKKSNLENKRVLFLEIGLLVAMSVALIAFEWSSAPNSSYIAQSTVDIGDIEEDIINTFVKEPEKVEPPKVEPIVLEIVDNSVEITDELPDFSTEIDPNEGIDIKIYEPADEPAEDLGFIYFAEDMPKFKGGDLNNFVNFIQSNLKYPAVAAENGIEGKVFLRFIVDKKGSVKNVELVRGVDPALDNAAIKAVSSSPKWEPGKQRGVPVNVCFNVPINFKLQ